MIPPFSGSIIKPFVKPFGLSGGFLPSDISTGVTWLDAGQGITLNGPDVADWVDQFGNGNDISQGTASDQPLFVASDASFNNKPVVRFDGAGEFMDTAAFSSPLSQPNTIFLVAKVQTILSGFRYFFDGLNISSRHILFTASGGVREIEIFAGSSLLGPATNTNTNIYGIQLNTTSSKLLIAGGAPVVSGDAGAQTLTGLTLGDIYSHVGAGHDMSVAEFILYNKLLTDSEMNQVGYYLAIKYGALWNLVADKDYEFQNGNSYDFQDGGIYQFN